MTEQTGSHTDREVTCTGCGADVGAIPTGEPCPTCGAVGRNVEIKATIMDAVAVMSDIALTVTRPQIPTWHTLWAQIERRIARLRDNYDPATPSLGSSATVEDDVDALLLCLFHLSEWLANDTTLGEQVRTTEAGSRGSVVSNSDALRLARDYANTFKHHTRNRASRHARLHATEITGNIKRIAVQFWVGDGPVATQDALELAEQCRSAWVEFLTGHGLLPPPEE